jgi:hypothetical protein
LASRSAAKAGTVSKERAAAARRGFNMRNAP